jgi:uncharacterized protein DUF3226
VRRKSRLRLKGAWRYAEAVGGPSIHCSKRLVVEGNDDRHSVLSLVRSRLLWPNNPEDAPVYIELGNGAEEILEPSYLTTLLKTRELKTTGIMLDANTKLRGRYERILNVCSQFFPHLPRELPAAGVIVDNEDQKRFGLWIMPDNASEGDLELFLRYLVPVPSEPLWKHATECAASAKSKGAPHREAHVSKANLYTWLAWQDPPGQSPGLAITKKILDPSSEKATPFVNWFRNLYELQDAQ